MAKRTSSLSDLPLDIPEAQLGPPIDPSGTETPLAPEQRQAIDALFASVEPVLSGEIPLSEILLEKIRREYYLAKNLNLGHFCQMVQIGARFDIDAEASTKAAMTAVAGPCWGCH